MLRTQIFEPLGMRVTGFHTEDVERLATAYQPTLNGLVVWDSSDGQWSRSPAFHDGAAGLVSTADDLRALAPMLLRGDQVLTADQVREMSHRPPTTEQRGLGKPFLGERGWGLGTSVVLEGPWAGAIGLGRGARHVVPRALRARPRRDPADRADVRDGAGTRCPHGSVARRWTR